MAVYTTLPMPDTPEETGQKILFQLGRCLGDEEDKSQPPCRDGESTVVQTFAEMCFVDGKRLGASFFRSL